MFDSFVGWPEVYFKKMSTPAMNADGFAWLDSATHGYTELNLLTISIFVICNLIVICLITTVAMYSTSAQNAAGDKCPPAVCVSSDANSVPKTRRYRSLSVSIDLEFPERTYKAPVYYQPASCATKDEQKKKLANTERNRTVSMNSNGEKGRRVAFDVDQTLSKVNGLAMLRKMPETFPLQILPEDCKLKIMSFLTPKERGVAAQVCKEWSRLIIVPSLWSIVDFTTFPLCARCSTQRLECNMLCYAAYKTKMKKFFRYLIALRPAMRRLKLEFDIDKDGWLELIQSLLHSASCRELYYVHLNWKETTVRPQSSNAISHTWSTSDYHDLMFHHRHRQRLFVVFFEFVVTAAPNIKSLTLPFDWSDRSMRAIGRLRHLNTLVLQTYFWTHWADQASLTFLLQMIPTVRKLVLEVWSHSGQGLVPYMFDSVSIEHLDVSASRGVCLSRCSLPRLTTLKVSRQPTSSPLVTLEAPHHLCLYQVLCDGAPNLRYLNALTLKPDWTQFLYEELEQEFKSVCSCCSHKSA